jgi:hypothetical protein
VRTQSRVDVAGQDGRIVAGTPTTIAGVAWAGDRRVSAVEVSTNGGKTWSEARLRPPIGPLSWRQWLYRWTPEVPGEATVMCRATDGEGNIQTGDRLPPHPAGATGLHAVTVEIA